MDSELIMKAIAETFDEPELYEVAMYCTSTLAVNDAVLRGIMNKETEVKGIPPEAFHLMKRFDNGLTLNEFFIANYAPIKTQLTLDDIKLNTLKNLIIYGEQYNDSNAFKQVKAIMLSRYDVLSVVAFLWKGVEFVEEFDTKFRPLIQLTPEYERFFKEKGA